MKVQGNCQIQAFVPNPATYTLSAQDAVFCLLL
jgi:hypothetical protein